MLTRLAASCDCPKRAMRTENVPCPRFIEPKNFRANAGERVSAPRLERINTLLAMAQAAFLYCLALTQWMTRQSTQVIFVRATLPASKGECLLEGSADERADHMNVQTLFKA